MNTYKKTTMLERYLTIEIGIEFKACLYFFAILFYYSVFRLCTGRWEASIIHMTEMIFLTYTMGYIQYYLFDNFDEGESFKGREAAYTLLCCFIYTTISYLGGWFDKKWAVTLGFFFFMLLAYLCAFLIYKLKRNIDAKILNEELKQFQERKKTEEILSFEKEKPL